MREVFLIDPEVQFHLSRIGAFSDPDLDGVPLGDFPPEFEEMPVPEIIAIREADNVIDLDSKR